MDAPVLLSPERVDPKSTAILVVDVQNDFCAPGGWFDRSGSELGLIQASVDRLLVFLEAARSIGLNPIFIRAIYDEIYLSAPMLERHRRTGLSTEHCQSGTWGADFYKVAPRDSEVVVIKHRYSAFMDTELSTLLRVQRIENVIMTGVTSNVCVESTARDAYMLDHHVVFVSDCTATYEESAHLATLANIERAFGIVVEAADVVDAWNRGGFEVSTEGRGLRSGPDGTVSEVAGA